MTSTEQKIKRVRELVAQGSKIKPACDQVGVSTVTYYEHQKKGQRSGGNGHEQTVTPSNGNGRSTERELTIQVDIDGEGVKISGPRTAVLKVLNKIG